MFYNKIWVIKLVSQRHQTLIPLISFSLSFFVIPLVLHSMKNIKENMEDAFLRFVHYGPL